MTHRATTVDDKQRRYHDTRHRSRADAIINNLKEVKSKGWIALSIADVNKDNLVLFDLPYPLRQELDNQRILYCLSPITKPYERSSIQLDTDTIARKRRRASEEERNEPQKGYFRGLTLWRPDPWFDAYSFWFAYGGNEGKLFLKDLHSLINQGG